MTPTHEEHATPDANALGARPTSGKANAAIAANGKTIRLVSLG